MPFLRRQVHAGNGVLRKARRGEALTAPPVTTNSDRERAVALGFEDAVKAVLADPHVQFTKLASLLADSRYGPLEVIEKFPWDVFERTFREQEQILLDQLRDGASQETRKVFMFFDNRDPEVLIWGAKHAAEMVTHISEEQRRLLRNLVMNSHLSGIAPKIIARDIRNVVGLTPKWQNAVTKYHRGLLDKGVDPSFAAKQSAKYHRRLLTARAEMIARTEVARADNYGKVVGWEQAIRNGLLTPGGKKTWHTAVTNVCPVCLPMDGKWVGLRDEFTVVAGSRVDHVLVPPSHPHCRCTISYTPPSLFETTGFEVEDLLEELRVGSKETFPEPNFDAFNEADSISPDAATAYPVLPDPPTFATRREAQEWADEHLTYTGTVEEYGRWDNKTKTFAPTTRRVTRYIDFEDLDVAAAQALVDKAVEWSREYPEAWSTVTKYGTLQAIYRGDPSYPRVGGGTYAQAAYTKGMKNSRSLGLSKAWFTKRGLKKYNDDFARGIETGWHPDTTEDSVHATLDHEFAHILQQEAIDPQAEDENKKRDKPPVQPAKIEDLITLLEKHTGHPRSFWDLNRKDCQAYVAATVSRYATQNWTEFIAEAYTGAQSSPNPTPPMLAVKEWFDSIRAARREI